MGRVPEIARTLTSPAALAPGLRRSEATATRLARTPTVLPVHEPRTFYRFEKQHAESISNLQEKPRSPRVPRETLDSDAQVPSAALPFCAPRRAPCRAPRLRRGRPSPPRPAPAHLRLQLSPQRADIRVGVPPPGSHSLPSLSPRPLSLCALNDVQETGPGLGS